jgi:hypothetical protein
MVTRVDLTPNGRHHEYLFPWNNAFEEMRPEDCRVVVAQVQRQAIR